MLKKGKWFMCTSVMVIIAIAATLRVRWKEKRNNKINAYHKMNVCNTLIGMCENHKLDLKFVNNGIVQGSNSSAINISSIKVEWINKPSWISINNLNMYLSHKCPVKNCIMTTNTNYVNRRAAIIFSTERDLNPVRLSKLKRPQDQVWIFFRMEPPTIFKMDWYRSPIGRNTMNWSWGYRLDSDIFCPYQKLTLRDKNPSRDYRGIFKKKKRVAAWVVSHCHTQSRREEYVKKLQNAGVSIDVFGKCSKKNRHPRRNIESLINNKYKFYIAFESSLCKDYVTEKFFKYFGLDTVVIVRGGLNYSRHFDKSTFIDTSDFASVEDVADHILAISENESLYTNILKRKDRYVPTTLTEEMGESACVLCKKMNKVKTNRNVYEDIASYIHKQTCFRPNDIE